MRKTLPNWGTWRARFHRHVWGWRGQHTAEYGHIEHLGPAHIRVSHYKVCDICGKVQHDRIEDWR